jgi:N-acetylglucosaminyldiphosphoundecaprenol N-acetyl-beta-D-mannosaminyltransferase
VNKETYFGISYTFGREDVLQSINELTLSPHSSYVVVADGYTLAKSTKNEALKKVVDEAAIVTCDSAWVPVYLRSIYHINRDEYAGSDLMMDLIQAKKYKMLFLGSSEETLEALQYRLSAFDLRIADMLFLPLPYLEVEQFDYPEITRTINDYSPDIVFVSLGMPKQEFFVHNLLPSIKRGVLIPIGAAFKFHSGLADKKRAPKWMIKFKLEWLYRIFSEPKKQIERCLLIIFTLPFIYIKEFLVKSKK